MEDKKEKILKDINNLEDYEKSDIMIDIFKMLDNFDKLDSLQYIQESDLIDKTCKIELVYSLINAMIQDTEKEIVKQIEKNNNFHDVHLKALYTELEKLENIIKNLE